MALLDRLPVNGQGSGGGATTTAPTGGLSDRLPINPQGAPSVADQPPVSSRIMTNLIPQPDFGIAASTPARPDDTTPSTFGFVKDLVQALPRDMAAIAVTFGQYALQKAGVPDAKIPTQIQPEGFEKLVFGDQPIEGFADTAARYESAIEKSAVAKEWGLAPFATPLAIAGAVVPVAFDFTGFGAGNIGKNAAIKALKNSTDVVEIAGILRTIGVDEDLVQPAALKFSVMTDAKEIEEGLEMVSRLQSTSKASKLAPDSPRLGDDAVEQAARGTELPVEPRFTGTASQGAIDEAGGVIGQIPEGARAALAPEINRAAGARTYLEELGDFITKRTPGTLAVAPLRNAAQIGVQIGEVAGDVSKFREIVRGTLTLSEKEDFAKALEDIQRHGNVVGKPKNTLDKPAENGYRAITVTVEAPNGGRAEIELTYPEVLKARQTQGEALDAQRKMILDKAKAEKRALTGDEMKQMKYVDERQRTLYNNAYQMATTLKKVQPMTSIGEVLRKGKPKSGSETVQGYKKKPLNPEKVPEHNTFDTAFDMTVQKKYDSYSKAVERIKKEAKPTKQEKDFLNFWTAKSTTDPSKTRLEMLKEPTESQRTSYRATYIKDVKKLISSGYDVPPEIIDQFPDFKKAVDARARYEKGFNTSFANESTGIDRSTAESYGFKVKNQDGTPIEPKEIQHITDAADEVQEVIGGYRDVMQALDLTVAHTKGKFPFLRGDTGGLYTGKHRTISVGVGQVKAFAHELFHAIDDASGTMSTAVTKHYAKGGEYDRALVDEAKKTMNGTTHQIENAMKLKPDMSEAEKKAAQLVRLQLTGYYRTDHEVAARLAEQYVAEHSAKAHSTNGADYYHSALGYWSKEEFAKLDVQVRSMIDSKLNLAREKLGTTPESFGASKVGEMDPDLPTRASDDVAEAADGAKKYPTIHEGGKVKMVEGKPVKIVDGVETFVHEGDGGWIVSEASTGRFIAESRSAEGAIAKAKFNIDEVGEEKFRKMLDENKLPEKDLPAKGKAPKTEADDIEQAADGGGKKPPPSDAALGISPGDDAGDKMGKKIVAQEFRTDKLDLVHEESFADIEKRLTALGLNTRTVRSFEEMKAAAEELGTDPRTLLKEVNKNRITDAEVIALRNLINHNSQRLVRIEEQLKIKPGDFELTKERGLLEQDLNAALKKLVKGGTEAGRAVASFRIMANRTMSVDYWLVRAKRELGNRDLTDEHRRIIQDLIGQGDKQGLATFVSMLRDASFAEKAVTLWKAGLLTNFTTHLANVGGNTTMSALLSVSDLIAAPLDVLASLISGVRTTTGGFKPIVAKVGGIKRGAVDAAEFLKTGVYPADLMNKYDLPHVPVFSPKPGQEGVQRIGNMILHTYTEAVFRSLGAEDIFFRQVAMAESLEKQAIVMAKNEGLSGAGAKERIKHLLLNPTNEMSMRAIDDAEYATFTSENIIANFIQRGKASLASDRGVGSQVALAATEIIMPFVKTPTNVAARVADFSPAGFIKAMVRFAAPKTRSQKNLVEDLSRAITGTGLMAFGAYLYQNGLMTGNPPENERERAQFFSEGKQANSVYLFGEWRNLNRVSPLGNLMALGAEFERLGEQREGAARAFATTMAGAKQLSEMSFLKGVSGVTRAVNEPDRFSDIFIEQTAGSIVPAIIGRTTKSIDPTQRVPDGVVEALKSRMPFMSESLPAKRDVFGHPMEVPGGRFNIIDPFQSTKASDNPLYPEARRIGVFINHPSNTVSKTKLTNREYGALQAVRGSILEASLTQLVASPEYQKMSTAKQAAAFEDVITDVNRAANEQVFPALMIVRYDLPTDTNPDILRDLLTELNGEVRFKNAKEEKQGEVLRALLQTVK